MNNMVEIEKFNGNWKVVPTAIPYPLSNDAVAILLHLIGKSKWKTGFMPDEPIPISKNELRKLTDKCWKKIDDSIQELVDFNFVSEFKYQPTAPSFVVINWEEIWELQQIVSKISTLGRIELRKMMRENGAIAFSKLPKNDIDELLNKYSYNSYDKAGEEANNIELPSHLGLEAYDERLEASHRRLEAYVLGLEAYNQRLEASNDLSYVLDKFSMLVHDVCVKDVELAKMTQNTIVSCVKKLSQLITVDEKLITTDEKLESELLTSGENSNKYIYKNNKSNNERSELCKEENEGELEGNDELPVDLNNFYRNSFWEKFLGKNIVINQETSSDKNIVDQVKDYFQVEELIHSSISSKKISSEEDFINQVMATENFQDKDSINQIHLREALQVEEIKVLEIPEWEETRDSSYPSFSAMEIKDILRYPREYQEDIHELIRTVFTGVSGDGFEDDEEESIKVPCKFFDQQLANIIEDMKEQDSEFSISFQDAKNIFFFEPVWNKINQEFDYVVSSSSIHDITQAPKKSRRGKGNKRQKLHEAEKFFDALSQVADENIDDLTNVEYAILLMMDDIKSRQEKGEVLFDDYQEYQFWDKAMKWADDSKTPFDELASILRTLPINLKHVTARPRLLNIEKIMDWNKKHSQESKVETLWKRKMAEPQN